MANQDYKEIAEIAKQRRAASIPSELQLPAEKLSNLPRNLSTVPQTSRHFSHDELEIIESEAEDILQKIRTKIWTALEVAEAFCKAATVAHQLTNCVTETLYPEAIARAKELDAYLESTGNVVGPLHGLPISLKDNFITPPHPSSIGMACWANVPTKPEEESTIVQVLRKLGAVYYVKTNTPVAMMMMETNNNVWGETRNALHSGCSAGGSSGGEGALIAMKASPLGIGTDIGGSIRIPAAFSNLYGLKPSAGRFPHWSSRTGIPGQEYVQSVNGPISRSLATLNLYCAALLSPAAAPWTLDPRCVPMSWRLTPQISPPGRPLRIGLITPHDGIVHAQPPVRRAIELTRAALTAAGHTVVPWDPAPAHAELLQLVQTAFFQFGGTAIMDGLAAHGEPVFPSMAGYKRAAAGTDSGGSLAAAGTQLREMNLAKGALCKAYLDRWMATADEKSGVPPLDGIVMAASPWAAPRLGVTELDMHGLSGGVDTKGKTGPYYGYTAVWNVLDMPSCTFPVTFVDKAVDVVGQEFKALNELDARIQADYDPEFYHGAPVGLQCVGLRLMEEKVLEMVGVIKGCLEQAGVK